MADEATEPVSAFNAKSATLFRQLGAAQQEVARVTFELSAHFNPAQTGIPKISKKGLREADPDKPKRLPTEYNKFMATNLTSYKLEHPEVPHAEAFTKVAGMWKNRPGAPPVKPNKVAAAAEAEAPDAKKKKKRASVEGGAAEAAETPADEGKKKKKKDKAAA